MRFCALIILSLIITTGCENPPVYRNEPTVYGSSADSQPEDECHSKTSYSVHKGAAIQWRVQKLTGDADETTLTGMTGVEGELQLADNNWENAHAIFKFTGKTTESGNALRDTRIEDYIFAGGLFQFELTEISGESLKRDETGSKIVTVKGVLKVAGQSTNIEMPALLNETADQISITPAENFSLNIRSLASDSNGLNLITNVAKLLTLVPGVEIKDEVAINFNLELFSNCKPSAPIKSTPPVKEAEKETEPIKKPETIAPDLPDLTPEAPANETDEVSALGLKIYENRCAKCHLAKEESNHHDMKANDILDHYARNFPTHVDVKWPTEKEAYAIEKIFAKKMNP